MAFDLPPLPNFNTNIPPPADPLQQYGKLLQLKQLSGQQQLLPLEIQEQQEKAKQAGIQTQTEQMQLDSQKKLMAAITSGAFNKYAGVNTPDGTGFDAGKAYQDLVANHGVLPDQAGAAVNSLLTIAKNQAEIAKTTGQAGEANAAVRAKTLEQLAAKLGSINDLTLEKAGPALEALKKDLVNNPKAYPGMTQQELAELYGADLGHLPAMEQLLGLEGKIADFHKSKAEAVGAEQNVEQSKINPKTGMSPNQAAEANKDVAVRTNPAVIAADVQKAAAEGRAKAQVEHEVAMGGDAAVQNVATHLIPQAKAAALKAGEDYAAAKTVSDRMAATMEAARKGNVVSYQIIPQEGTLQITTSQGVHRINRTEIEQYEGGGSLWQRLEGHVGKTLTGKSIPDSVLNDMADIQKIQADGAESKYSNTLKTINQTYGSTFKPVQMEGLKSQQFSVGQEVNIKGKTMKVSKVYPDGSFDAQ